MKKLLAHYDNIRGKIPKDLGVKFWDLVVISAGDKDQENWYKSQLELKLHLADIPDVKILCIADPPGPRIGSGGATLNILNQLQEMFKEDMFSWRILIIHSGGYSKRLPSHSCSGKIFSPLPILPTKGGPYQMLDLKLCLYLPFLERMAPGVFITASDDIEVFDIDCIPKTDIGEVVVALAHPSNLYIGSTHGVYVMEKSDPPKEECLIEIKSCLEVLQKPSIELMQEREAILTSQSGESQVFSDSAFWFHHQTTRKLINLFKKIAPVPTELCIYGDFLTFLGSREDKPFEHNLKQEKQSLSRDLKLEVGQAVGDTSLQVIKLNRSKFYHLGTSQEYLDGLTDNGDLGEELNLHPRVYCKLTNESSNSSTTKQDISSSKATNDNRKAPECGTNEVLNETKEDLNETEDAIEGVILNSCINGLSVVHKNSVVEYSIINPKIIINSRTILSNVVVEEPTQIPAGFIFHTIPISTDGGRRFVTIAFSVEDDLKIAVNKDTIKFGGRQLKDLSIVSMKLSLENIFPQGENVPLWVAKLFPSADTMGKSFSATAQLVNSFLAYQAVKEDDLYAKLYSMADILDNKDCLGIIEYRKHVTELCKPS